MILTDNLLSCVSDIDGIKVRSDVEGGASKRSYNYRVSRTTLLNQILSLNGLHRLS